MDDDYNIILSQFFMLKNLFKNLCENNFEEFKKFFAIFIPKVEENSDFNRGNQTLVFNYYVHLECFANMSTIWSNIDKRLVLADRPGKLLSF